jgi:hypothetical protein
VKKTEQDLQTIKICLLNAKIEEALKEVLAELACRGKKFIGFYPEFTNQKKTSYSELT